MRQKYKEDIGILLPNILNPVPVIPNQVGDDPGLDTPNQAGDDPGLDIPNNAGDDPGRDIPNNAGDDQRLDIIIK